MPQMAWSAGFETVAPSRVPPRRKRVTMRWRLAVHEAGHAVLHVITNRPFQYVTIVRRGPVAGCVRWDGSDAAFEAALAFAGSVEGLQRSGMALLLGGAAAEVAIFGSLGVGYGADVQETRRQLRLHLALAGGPVPRGKRLAALVQEMFDHTTRFMTSSEVRHAVETVADALLTRNTMSFEQVWDLVPLALQPRPSATAVRESAAQ
jgi:ATP-dependent Zn protease